MLPAKNPLPLSIKFLESHERGEVTRCLASPFPVCPFLHLLSVSERLHLISCQVSPNG